MAQYHSKNQNIPDNFIARQLNETQYISKKAKEILLEVCRNVYTTTGSITDRLREDWGLTDIMKENCSDFWKWDDDIDICK